MYKIIGADGKEYGPVSTDVLRQWMAEGRLSAQTRVRAEGTSDWKMLGELPEFAAAPPAPPNLPTLPAAAPAPSPAALDKVSGPAIGLIITGALNILLSLLRIVLVATGVSMRGIRQGAVPPEFQKLMETMMGPMALLISLIGVVVGIFILLGGVKMRKLESHSLCQVASVLAMIPCVSACCLVGLPIGIWALVMLSKPEVKSAFK